MFLDRQSSPCSRNDLLDFNMLRFQCKSLIWQALQKNSLSYAHTRVCDLGLKEALLPMFKHFGYKFNPLSKSFEKKIHPRPGSLRLARPFHTAQQLTSILSSASLTSRSILGTTGDKDQGTNSGDPLVHPLLTSLLLSSNNHTTILHPTHSSSSE